jgi:hypothetical protein
MTVPEYMARQTERMAEALAHFVATTPEDKLVWHPTLEGGSPTRSILEQVGECVSVNRFLAALMRGESVAMPPGGRPEIHFKNGQDAQEQLVTSARELTVAMRALTPEDLVRPYAHPRGPILGENLIIMCYRNMAYHAGQANFIQILYGDTEFHVPPTWR